MFQFLLQRVDCYRNSNPRFCLIEREFHRWLKTQNSTDPRVKIGIGDDAAVLRNYENAVGIVVATDAIADGTHFDIGQHSLKQIGRKALAVNLSDMAAMGATPTAAVLTMMLPAGFTLEQAQQLFLGAQELAGHFSVSIVGGDTNRWPGKLVLSVTLMGREYSVGENSMAWRMDTAVDGDLIVVSGSFGGSLLGHHLDFLPRIQLAQYLIRNYKIHAATDASDSLSLDLAAIGNASGLGMRLDVEKIPIAAAAMEQSQQSGKTPLVHALTDGEDFELILAVAADEAAAMMLDPMCCDSLTVIGRFVSETGFYLVDQDQLQSFDPAGYSH